MGGHMSGVSFLGEDSRNLYHSLQFFYRTLPTPTLPPLRQGKGVAAWSTGAEFILRTPSLVATGEGLGMGLYYLFARQKNPES